MLTVSLPYLIVNSVLLLISLRYYGYTKERVKHVIALTGNYRPWLMEHRELAKDHHHAQLMVLMMVAWLAVGQWVLLGLSVKSGI